MDPISNFNRLMQLLKKPASTSRAGGRQKPSPGRPGPSDASPIDYLKQQVAERIQSTDDVLSVPNRARYIFIESVLAWEFGDALLDDPNLPHFVRQISECIDQDPGLSRQLEAMLQTLK